MKHITKTKIPKLSTLIEAKRFDWVNSDIKDGLFETPKEIGTDFKLYSFDQYISSEDAIKEMEKNGYRAATAWELLTWPDWNYKDWVVALGSVARVDGRRDVVCLYEDVDERGLYLRWWLDVWSRGFRFLAVKQPSLGSSDSGTGHLGALTLEAAIAQVKEAGYEIKKKSWFITGQGLVMELPNGKKKENRRKFLGSYVSKEQAEAARDEIRNKYGETLNEKEQEYVDIIDKRLLI